MTQISGEWTIRIKYRPFLTWIPKSCKWKLVFLGVFSVWVWITGVYGPARWISVWSMTFAAVLRRRSKNAKLRRIHQNIGNSDGAVCGGDISVLTVWRGKTLTSNNRRSIYIRYVPEKKINPNLLEKRRFLARSRDHDHVEDVPAAIWCRICTSGYFAYPKPFYNNIALCP